MIEELESLTEDALAHGAKPEVIVVASDVYDRLCDALRPASEPGDVAVLTINSGTFAIAMRRHLPAGRLMTATRQWLDDYDECVRQFEEARRD